MHISRQTVKVTGLVAALALSCCSLSIAADSEKTAAAVFKQKE